MPNMKSMLCLTAVASLFLAFPVQAQETQPDTTDSQTLTTDDQSLETAPADSRAATQFSANDIRTVGPAIEVPMFDSVDENGVDLINGYFRAQGPTMSAGTENHSLSFAMEWVGQAWITPIPSITKEDGDYTVRYGGISEEFDSNFNPVAPIRGGSLTCNTWSGRDWTMDCFYRNRNGDRVTWSGPSPFSTRPLDPEYRVAHFGNVAAGGASVNSNSDLVTDSEGYGYQSSWPDGISYGNGSLVVFPNTDSTVRVLQEFGTTVSSPLLTLDLQVRPTAPGTWQTVQSLTIATPGNSMNDWEDHFLFPRDTTQTITDPEGRVWQYVINDDREMTRVTRPDGTQVNITSYNGDHRVETLTNPVGTWFYSYSENATYRTITRTNPDNGVMAVRSHKDRGYVVQVTDELGRTTFYDHNPTTHYLTAIRYPEGNRLEFDYDARGNVTASRSIPGAGQTGPIITVSAEYVSNCEGGQQGRYPRNCNQPQRYQDSNGSLNSDYYEYRYDSSGTSMPTLIQRPPVPYPGAGGLRHWTTVNEFIGAPIAAPNATVLSVSRTCQASSTCSDTDSNAILTEIGYLDNTGLILPETVTTRAGDNSLSVTITNSYDAVGNLTAVDGPLAGDDDTTRYAYNENRELIASVSPDPDGTGPLKPPATRTVYDTMGRVILEETGTVDTPIDTSLSTFVSLDRTATQYDTMGRPVLAVSATSAGTYAVLQTSYDVLSRPICSTVRMNAGVFPNVASNGIISGGSLPSSACVLGTTGSSGPDRVTQTNYDAVGQVTSVLRAFGTTDQITYASYTYDLNGNRESVTDANGNLSQFTYDGHNRLVRWEFPSATTPGVVNPLDAEVYVYDNNGNRTSLRRRDGQLIAYQYDALNRMTLKDVPGTTQDVYYGYELQGEMLEARFGSATGLGIVNTYDILSRMTSSANSTGGTTRTLTYGYDLAGNRTSITHPDGETFSYIYDPLYRNTRVREGSAIGPNISVFNFNQLGQRTAITRGAGPDTSYGYNAVNRLSSLVQDLSSTINDLTLDFTYNPAGQLVTRGQSNPLYAFAGLGDVSDSYTANGLNQYTAVSGQSFTHDPNGNLTSDGTNTYVYDVENRLVSVSGGHAATLTYDPLGRLFSVTGGPSGDVEFLQDGDALVGEYDGSGTLLARYVHGPGVDEPLIWYDGAAVSGTTRRYLGADHQGSIITTSGSTGDLIAANRYDTWGISADTNIGRFGYTGQAWLEDIGLYYYRARMYAPELGRFLQTDPIGYEDNLNLYAYVGNDPVNLIDPTGTADLNLFDFSDLNSWWSAANAFEPANDSQIFTIMGHGFQNGTVLDDRNGANQPLTPEDLVGLAEEHGYQQGGHLLITSCNCGGNYAQRVADITGGTVFAADGFVTVHSRQYLVGDTVTLRSFSDRALAGRQGGWWAFSSGSVPRQMGQSVNFNPEQGVFFRRLDPDPIVLRRQLRGMLPWTR